MGWIRKVKLQVPDGRYNNTKKNQSDLVNRCIFLFQWTLIIPLWSLKYLNDTKYVYNWYLKKKVNVPKVNLNDTKFDPYDTQMTPKWTLIYLIKLFQIQRQKYAIFETGKLALMDENNNTCQNLYHNPKIYIFLSLFLR